MEFEKLKSSIFTGLKEACDQSLYFNGFPNPNIKPEYLLTVNIAQALIDISENPRIILEKRRTDFINEMFNDHDLIQYIDNLNKYIDDPSNNFSTKNKERIDIVINNQNNEPEYLIEIKGAQTVNINTTKLINKPIEKDIERCIHYLEETNAKKRLKSAIITFICDDKVCQSEDDIEKRCSVVKKKIEENIKNFNTSVKIEVFTQTSYKHLKTCEELQSYHQDNLADAISDNAHYIGVILKISPKFDL